MSALCCSSSVFNVERASDMTVAHQAAQVFVVLHMSTSERTLETVRKTVSFSNFIQSYIYSIRRRTPPMLQCRREG